MCDCQSYNRPDLSGATPALVLDHAMYWPGTGRPAVSVDACIAGAIERLWAAGVETRGSCCGHNARPPQVFLARPADAEAAARVLSLDPREWQVMFWAGGPVEAE